MANSGSGNIERFSFMNGASIEYVESQYRNFLNDPMSVEESWRYFFEGFKYAESGAGPSKSQGSGGELESASKVESYINLIRRLGHLNSHLNPLDAKPELLEEFRVERHGLGNVQPDDMFAPANLPLKGEVRWAEIQDLLYETYCGTIGADFRDIASVEGVRWFQEEMESCRNRPVLSKDEKIRILDKLVEAEGFEKFLGDRFLGQKRFSLEGLESVVPLMDFLTEDACAGGLEEICIGMAHRGRLNLLANYMGKPYELMLKEFEGSDYNTHDIDGDVKYHMGYANYIETISGRKALAYLLPNPSHLEAVNPVVEGFARARQRLLDDKERNRVLPVLMHGDASFIGQGIVCETLNLSGLDYYTTGGTIHIILNNQVGFTTNPYESRSCTYSSDIAKIVRAPILHVNADDPEAVVWTGELAVKYRQKFKRDVVIDIVGYRRHGHNETDEPSFTQPAMYRKIKKHTTALTLYGEELVRQGVMTDADFKDRKKKFRAMLQGCLNRVRSGNLEILSPMPKELDMNQSWAKISDEDLFKKSETSVNKKTLKDICKKITTVPEDFNIHPKIERLFTSRRKMVDGEGAVDWGLAELLAYASLAKEGFHVRLSGQDCRRGTFSHRHAVIKDSAKGTHLHLLNQLGGNQAPVSVINSPLSEAGVLGFEFGYSVAHKGSLVLWEAQFGDFCNGAQIIIDQFLAASEAKWKQVCNLVLLLPHGYEGMGPEHSSARPERFLQLCGNNNMQVANCTTPAQLFHLLRRQMHREFRKPLVVLTPKSLLRHPRVVSKMEEFTDGQFHELLDDPFVEDPDKITRVVFCTGKIYYELLDGRENHGTDNVALVRVEQLYPFPEKAVEDVLGKYKNTQEVLWTQEEPSNMGYWTFLRHRIKRQALRNSTFRYAGRKGAGTTAEGSVKSHQREQQRVIQDTLGLACPINPDVESVAAKRT